MKNLITFNSTALQEPLPACLIKALPVFIALLFMFNGRLLPAQTVIGGVVPDASAVLDLQSTDKGLLLPRMSETQRNAIANPATGLLVFNTTNNCLEINVGTSSSPDWVALKCRTGIISALNCSGVVPNGTLLQGAAASGVSVQVPYTGGNGGIHSGQTVTSTGITGLTATLASGNFATGAGNLTYTLSGTPDTVGMASFALNIGGQSCTLSVPVGCWAKVSATDILFFMCHNLASANTSADPFTPSWEINGGYWQWGRKGPDASQWLNTNTTIFAHGPTGTGTGESNSAATGTWSGVIVANGAWSNTSKTENDPCPAGYRVPTKAQWDAVRANNTKNNVGTNWTASNTNYSTGRRFGPALMLPAPGYRDNTTGALSVRGNYGYYWSSTEVSVNKAWNLFITNGSDNVVSDFFRSYGFSVRCAAQ